MRKYSYSFLPPSDADSKFDKITTIVLKNTFPFVWKYWKSPKGLMRKKIESSRYCFTQFAAWFIHHRYRRWMRQAAHHVLEKPFGEDNLGVPSLRNAYSYVRCYNCPPTMCKTKAFLPRHTDITKVGLAKRCNRSFCPNCHFRKVLRLAYRVRLGVRSVRKYYQNLHLFRYRTPEFSDVDPKELKKRISVFIEAAGDHPSYLGSMWYIFPKINYPSGDLTWSGRVLFLAGGSFDTVDVEGSEDFKLKRVLPAAAKHIYSQVASTMTWGQWPFWYSPEATNAWDRSIRKRLAGKDILYARESHKGCAALDKFEKYNHKKNRGKRLPFQELGG